MRPVDDARAEPFEARAAADVDELVVGVVVAIGHVPQTRAGRAPSPMLCCVAAGALARVTTVVSRDVEHPVSQRHRGFAGRGPATFGSDLSSPVLARRIATILHVESVAF